MSTALQRLRQGQGRCQQQLLSLLQWHQQQAQEGGLQQQRGMADQAPAKQFAKERKGFQNSLSELRKTWAKERLEKEAARAAAEAAARCAAAHLPEWEAARLLLLGRRAACPKEPHLSLVLAPRFAA